MNKKLKKRDRGGVDDYPDAPANMTAKKYNKKHRVLDLDARDARRREESVARSAIKAADAVFALHEVRRRPCRAPGHVPPWCLTAICRVRRK